MHEEACVFAHFCAQNSCTNTSLAHVKLACKEGRAQSSLSHKRVYFPCAGKHLIVLILQSDAAQEELYPLTVHNLALYCLLCCLSCTEASDVYFYFI